MKRPTLTILLIVHCAAFVLLFAGKLLPGMVGNFFVSIGLAVEIPGWYIGAKLFGLDAQAATLAFAFVFNGLLYGTGGLVIDSATRKQ